MKEKILRAIYTVEMDSFCFELLALLLRGHVLLHVPAISWICRCASKVSVFDRDQDRDSQNLDRIPTSKWDGKHMNVIG